MPSDSVSLPAAKEKVCRHWEAAKALWEGQGTQAEAPLHRVESKGQPDPSLLSPQQSSAERESTEMLAGPWAEPKAAARPQACWWAP